MPCSVKRNGSFARMNARLVAATVCVGAVMACAGERTMEPPPASAATEPEPTAGGAEHEAPPLDPAAVKEAHRTIDQTANTSERLAEKTADQAVYADGNSSVPGTPDDGKTALEQAAGIRRALMAADGLSAGARKVDVLVEQGRVTLRGRVESAVEKARVEEIARTTINATGVTNNLEVAH